VQPITIHWRRSTTGCARTHHRQSRLHRPKCNQLQSIGDGRQRVMHAPTTASPGLHRPKCNQLRSIGDGQRRVVHASTTASPGLCRPNSNQLRSIGDGRQRVLCAPTSTGARMHGPKCNQSRSIGDGRQRVVHAPPTASSGLHRPECNQLRSIGDCRRWVVHTPTTASPALHRPECNQLRSIGNGLHASCFDGCPHNDPSLFTATKSKHEPKFRNLVDGDFKGVTNPKETWKPSPMNETFIGRNTLSTTNNTMPCGMGEPITVPFHNLITRQRTEGHLTWMWGLQSNLPETYPCKRSFS